MSTKIKQLPLGCLMCGNPKTTLWTLDNGRRAAAMNLCDDHAEQLEILMDAAGNRPPRLQVPIVAYVPPARKKERRHEMVPLTDWEPPGPPPLVKEETSRDVLEPLDWEPPAEGAGG